MNEPNTNTQLSEECPLYGPKQRIGVDHKGLHFLPVVDMFKRELTTNFEKHLRALNNPNIRSLPVDGGTQPVKAQQSPGESHGEKRRPHH